MIDFLFDPKVMTFVCLWIWIICTIFFFIYPFYRGRMISERIDLRDPAWVAGLFGIMTWFAMWAFRTMY